MYRIIGILAIVGFVIILLPFFISIDDAPSEPAVVKAPAFPNQAAESNLDLPHDTIDQAHSVPVPVEPLQPVEPVEPAGAAPRTPNSETLPNPSQEEQSDDNSSSNEIVSEPHAEATHKPILQNSIAVATQTPVEPVPEKEVKPIAKIAKPAATAESALSKKPILASLQNPRDDHGLLQLKSPSWVIQVGSFKNKTNALRLVNQLRKNGYKAFIQNVSSPFGDNTRVYIGPEYKQSAAKLVANQIEQDMHLHGIVLNFKPLTM